MCKKEPKKRTEVYQKAINYESNLNLEMAKSKKTAWIIASVSLLFVFMSLVALLIMLPLKEKVPVVSIVDKYTGYATVLTNLYNKDLSTNEALNKYWVQNFVKQYESYNYSLIPVQYENVSIWAETEVKKKYQFKYDENLNPAAIQKILGRKSEIRVKILSMTPLSDTAIRQNEKEEMIEDAHTMSVRIDKEIWNNGTFAKKVRGIVTLTYIFNNKLSMSEKVRNINPLGFRVLSYRFDHEQ